VDRHTGPEAEEHARQQQEKQRRGDERLLQDEAQQDAGQQGPVGHADDRHWDFAGRRRGRNGVNSHGSYLFLGAVGRPPFGTRRPLA
jgi:hypothetical protein